MALARHERGFGIARRRSARPPASSPRSTPTASGSRPSATARSRNSSTACRPPPNPSRFVQVDLTKPAAEATLDAGVVWDLQRGVGVLHALTRYRRHEGLRQFREQFVRRYETREIPLAQALDEENGIGFERSAAPSAEAAPLLAGMPLQLPQDPSVPWSRRDAFLLGKLTRALAAGSSEITIEAAEAAGVSDGDIPPLPDAFEVVATVLPGPETGSAPGSGPETVPRWPCCTRRPGRPARGSSAASATPTTSSHRLVRAHLAAEEALRPERVSPRSSTSRRAGSATSCAGRCCAATRSPTSAAPARRPTASSCWTTCSCPSRASGSCSARGGSAARSSRGSPPRTTTSARPRRLPVPVRAAAAGQPRRELGLGPAGAGAVPAPRRQRPHRSCRGPAGTSAGRRPRGVLREPPRARPFAAGRSGCGTAAACPGTSPSPTGITSWPSTSTTRCASRRSRTRSPAGRARRSPRWSPGPGELCASGPEGAFTHQVIVPFVRSPQARPQSPRSRSSSRPAARHSRRASSAARRTGRVPGVSRPARSGCTSSCSPARRPPIRCCGGSPRS